MSIKIDQAFTQAFIDSSFGLPIVHENTDYTPVEGAAYAEIYLVPNDVTPYGLSSVNETDGLFQIVLYYPIDKGAIDAKTKADEIFAAFPIGGNVTYDGQRSKITNQQRSRGVPENGWYRLTLSISYRSFLARG